MISLSFHRTRPLVRSLFAGILLTICTHPTGAPGAEVEGVAFPEEIRLADTTLKLSGVGTVRYLALFKIYVGALYLPRGSGTVVDNHPRRLELSYLHDFKAADFRKAMRRRIVIGLDEEQRHRLRARIDAFAALFRDVRVGDRYTMTYLPGEGTAMDLNGRRLGSVPGADFAAALFDIWLGPEPLDAAFRAALLGEG